MYPWNHIALSYRYDIPVEDIKKHTEIDWDEIVYYRYDLSLEEVEKNKNIKWNWVTISANPCCICNESDEQMLSRRYMAAYKIQQYWRKVISNPNHHLCKKRLLYWEFQELENLKKRKLT
jgi:hypothetical protein